MSTQQRNLRKRNAAPYSSHTTQLGERDSSCKRLCPEQEGPSQQHGGTDEYVLKQLMRNNAAKIQIFALCSSNFAVFNDVDLLLRQFRFLCHSVHRPKNELTTELPNVPVILLPEQAQLLLENGFAQLRRTRKVGTEESYDDNSKHKGDEHTGIEPFQPPQFPQSVAYGVKLTVFRDLWRKGFYLADGAKFGCDYLAYRRPPPEQHSEFMVLCTDANANDGAPPLRPLSLIGLSRASTQVRKRILLAIVSLGSPVPYYLEMNWWKGVDGRC